MTRPATVAAVRGLIEAVLLAGIGAAVVWIGELAATTVAPWAPLGLYLLRQAEGFIDEKIDPAVERREPGG